MRDVHHMGRLGKEDLLAIAQGRDETVIDDMEFFETLAVNRCLVMPPWVFHITPDGHLENVVAVRYTADYALDKAAMLLSVMERLPQLHSSATVEV